MMLRNHALSWKSLIGPNRVYLWCAFASNPIVVLIGSISNQRNAARRLEEEVANTGVPPLDE